MPDIQINRIKETSLYVTDLERTEEFYSGKLNLAVIGKSEGRHIFFRAGGSVLLCFMAEATRQDESLPAHFGEGKQHIAFEVPEEQYEAMKTKLLSAGIAIEHEQEWSPKYRSFYFRDPDGHSLEVVPEGMWD